MTVTLTLAALSDDELLSRLTQLVHDSRRTEADLVAHIGEMDLRRLYAREASPSMFSYCTRVLHLSGAEAYLRITASRVSREHPLVLAMLADGRLHLSAIAKLAPHLTTENRDAVLSRAAHRSKREILELVAELAPRPDVPSLIRKLPEIVRPQLLQAPLDGQRSSHSVRASPQSVNVPVPGRGSELRPDGVPDRADTSDGRSSDPDFPSQLVPALEAFRAELQLQPALARAPGTAAGAERALPPVGRRTSRSVALQGPVHRDSIAARQARTAPGPAPLGGPRRRSGCDRRSSRDRDASATRGAPVREESRFRTRDCPAHSRDAD